MIKTISMENGQSFEINSSFGWLYIFQEQFGYDVLPLLMPMLEAGLKAVGIAVQGATEKDGIDTMRALANFDDESISEIMTSFAGLQLTTLLNIVWAMAKNANDNISEPKVFYNSFDEFPSDLVIPEVIKQVVNTNISKKNRAKLALRAKEIRKTSQSQLSESQSPELTED